MNLIYSSLLTFTLVLVPLSAPSVTVYHQAPTPEPPVVSVKRPATRSLVQKTILTPSQEEIKQKIAENFGDDMVAVVRCESNFKQFNNDGTPLQSRTSDVGIMQINQVHWARAKSLGLDIFNSVEDNITMGKIILKEQGFSAWTCYNPERSG